MAICRDSKKVVVLTNIGKTSRRDCLGGIFRFAREKAQWSLRLVHADEHVNPQSLADLNVDEIDGIITSESGVADVMGLLAKCDIPLVSIGSRSEASLRRLSRVAFVKIDDAEIGRFGAERLSAYGQFASCAFVKPPQEAEWANLRARHFRLGFQKLTRCPYLEIVGTDQLSQWLARLPKPAALMAANDTLAFSVLEAAASAGIPVPQSLAVLGTDNDVFLCDAAKPPLSSVLPDHEEVGFLAATELHRLMTCRRRPAKPKTVLCRGHRFVERESTRHIVPAARVLREALAFIDAEAVHGIGPAAVAKHLGISRRLLDLRFGEFSGRTVAETIRDRQLKVLRDLLSDSRLPIRQITEKCGFRNETYPKELFKARFGMSMREWRAQARRQQANNG